MWSNVNFPPNGKTCSKFPTFIVGRTDGWSCENSSTDLSHNPPGNEICTYSRRKMIPAKFGYFETYRNGSIKRQKVLPQPAEPPMINTSAADDNTRVWNPGCGSMYVVSGFDPIFNCKNSKPGEHIWTPGCPQHNPAGCVGYLWQTTCQSNILWSKIVMIKFPCWKQEKQTIKKRWCCAQKRVEIVRVEVQNAHCIE